jgi:hypothetical protein
MVMCEFERAAWHEAAHCCVGEVAFGHPVQEVAISENGEISGYCRPMGGVMWEYEPEALAKRELLLQYAIRACAGRAAMDKVWGYKPSDDRNWRASKDHAQALECCLTIADGDAEAAEYLLAYSLRRAEILVEKHWGEIGRVAYGLLVHERLTGDQVREILERTRAEQSEHELAAA